MKQDKANTDVDLLKRGLGALPEPTVLPAFIVVIGLPGTGKSYFCGKLAGKAPFCIIESDVMRKSLFATPDYSAQESARLFKACHGLIEDLLYNGIPVIFDATNLAESNRERLYRIADRTKAKLILVRLDAPSEVVYKRLKERKEGADPDNKSDADWEVYLNMKQQVGGIRRNYICVDTSRDIEPVIDKIVRMLNK